MMAVPGRDATRSAGATTVPRFCIPAVEDTSPTKPSEQGPLVTWPDSAYGTFAYEQMAQEIMRQWSPGTSRHTLSDHAVLAFTSPSDGDGKTNLLLQLAPCLAEKGPGNVLVVDADFRGGALTSRICMERATQGRKKAIFPTNVPGLSVLPALSGHGKGWFRGDWIEHLRETWPLTLLDLPSLAHPHVASLAAQCGGVYLVSRLGYTKRRLVVEASRLLTASGGRLLGCLVIQ